MKSPKSKAQRPLLLPGKNPLILGRYKMNLGLSGKTAVVSGSTAGIGFAIAAALAAEGAKVIVNGRTEARVSAAVERIGQRVKNADVRGIPADLGTSRGVETFLQQAPEADILVNNLGIFEVKSFLDIPDSDWLRFFEVNVLSGVRLSRHYLPGMLKKNWGRIIFISSESAQHIPAEMIHYGMTKTAQVAIARGDCGIHRRDWRHREFRSCRSDGIRGRK